jgi:hypothetical protein
LLYLICTLVKLTKAPKFENVRLITNENLANISLQDVKRKFIVNSNNDDDIKNLSFEDALAKLRT